MRSISSGESENVSVLAVLDTNILISATFWRGASDHVLRSAEEGLFEAIISEEILTEYDRSLREPEFRKKVSERTLTALWSRSHIVRLCHLFSSEPVHITLKDPDDTHLFGCAISSEATHIVTNDKAVLALNGWQGIHILTPEEFLKTL